MRGVNKAIIIGHLGADPETRQFNDGGCVTNISVATSEQWTDKQTGEKRETTEWHRIALFNRLGEIAAQYLRKGSMVYIEGSIKTRKWQDQSGQDRYTTEIRADSMQMLGGQNTQGGNNQGYQSNNGQNYNQQQGGQNFNQDTHPQNFNQSQPQNQANQSYNQAAPVQNQQPQQNNQPANMSNNNQVPMTNQGFAGNNPVANDSFVDNRTTAGMAPSNPGGPTDDDIPFFPAFNPG